MSCLCLRNHASSACIPAAHATQRRKRLHGAARKRLGLRINATLSEMLVGEIEKDLPVFFRHRVLASANVIAELSAGQYSLRRWIAEKSFQDAKKLIGSSGCKQHFVLAFGVGPLVLHGVAEQHWPRSHQGDQAM